MQKIFALVSLWISLFIGLAAAQSVYLTGQAARAVIGQTTFTTQTSGGVNSLAACPPTQTANCIPTTSSVLPGVPTKPSDTVFGGIGGLAYAAGTLFAADDNRLGLLPNNNRVLMFNNIHQLFPQPTDSIPQEIGRCPLCGGQANVILGQPNISTVTGLNPPTANSLRLPLGIASDGKYVAIADTANNRVLLWKSIPTTTGQAADIVLGQQNFTTYLSASASATTMRGPQGVWIQNGKLFVADTGNNRILIWKSMPTTNGQPADFVLGQPNMTSGGQFNLVSNITTSSSIMASPTSVTSDGTHLFVADLGFSRVLIWNSIPTTNMQPADVEIGQLNMTNSIADDVADLCASNGVDSSNNPLYPASCLRTLNYPRFALADDQGRLYVADGGNDRVLVYNTIPTANGVAADVVLGQPDEFSDVVSSNTSILQTGAPIVQSAANVTPTPTSLAWDGTNLYVADPSNYRILVFTPGQPNVPVTGIVNSASQAIFAQANVFIGGTIQVKDTVTVTINGTGYTYTVQTNDTLDTVAQGVVDKINSGAGDPNVVAYDQAPFAILVVVARASGSNGNSITLATSASSSAKITATISGSTLAGGGNAGQVAPGTLISINGTNLADGPGPISAPNGMFSAQLPWTLGGVEVYADGNRLPLLMVSPTQINAQIPWEVVGSNSTSVYVRTTHKDGSVTISNAIGVPLLNGAPGIFATPGTTEPRVAQVYHASSFATGVVTFNAASIQAGDAGTIIIGDRPYTYTVLATDTVFTIIQAFVNKINSDPEVNVTAKVADVGFAMIVTAKVPGPPGNGIVLLASVTTATTNTSGAMLVLTATSGTLCCANRADAPVTTLNPAVPGESIYFYATGLGLVCGPQDLDPLNNCLAGDAAKAAVITGVAYTGPVSNVPLVPINSTVGGGATAVISENLVPGTVGLYRVQVQLPTSLTTNPFTQLFIQQQFNASNIVTLPIGNGLQF